MGKKKISIVSAFYSTGSKILFPLLICFLLFSMAPGSASAAQVTLTWDPNTDAGLAGYRVYYGTASGSYSFSVDAGKSTTAAVTNLQNATTYYFAAVTYDTSGNESGYSNEVSYTTPGACTYALSAASKSFGSSGGPGTVNVTTQTGCTWTAVSNASWVVITSNSSASGNGTVNYSVANYTGSASRTGTLTIAGKSFTVSQSGTTTCTYSISPTSKSFAVTGGTGTISVTAQSGCSWSASSGAAWISITSGGSGSGNGNVAFSVAANSAASRSGTITAAGKTFTVSQSGTSGYALTVAKSGAGTGTVTANPAGTTFAAGTVVTLTAAAGSSSNFAGWSGACTGTSPSCSVTMNAAKSVTAAFNLKTYSLTATAGANGSISPAGTLTVNYGGSQTFTITPSAGYGVADVKVDGVSAGALTSLSFGNIAASHTIAAIFTPNAAGTNLLGNGGFETGSLSAWQDGNGFTASTASDYSGTYGARMARNGRIYQNFATTVGKTYYVSARVRIDQQITAPSSGGLVVKVNTGGGTLLARSAYLKLSNSPAGSWSLVKFSFTAKTSQSRIVFRIDGNGRFDASADDFIVSPNPIP